jgi:hypothetical protein
MEFSTTNTIDVIDIILYKYNYYDNKIWTGVKNKMDFMVVNEQSVLVSPKALGEYVAEAYPNELNKFKSIGSEFLHKDANSIYFINLMLSEMKHLKWVKLTLDKSKNYSRLVSDQMGEKRISFSYKILHATFRLYDIFEDADFEAINEILYSIELLSKGKPYKRHKLVEIIEKLEMWMEKNAFDQSNEAVELVGMLLDMIEPKMEGDNPEVLLVTDY